jgi:hypothetical protein
MADRPTLPEPTSDQGQAGFRSALAANLVMHEPADLLGSCPSVAPGLGQAAR